MKKVLFKEGDLMTNYELVDFAKSKLGVPYVYGMKGTVMTLSKYNQLKSMYGSMVWDSDRNKIGKVCCDCSGLISWATGIIRGSSQYKNKAKAVYPISTIKNAPIGALVWQQGHIGIYIGLENNIPHYIAEDGSAYGCRKNKLSNAKFTHWFLCTDVTYINDFDNKEDEDDMTRYNKVSEVPSWGKDTVQKLIDKKLIADRNNMNLSEDMLRIFVMLDRNGTI